MPILGIVTCEILEMEFTHLLVGDPEVHRITVVENSRSSRFIEILEASGTKNLHRIPHVRSFAPERGNDLEVLVRVLEVALHNRKRILQEGLTRAARDMARHVDALFLGYGLCGNALEKPDELFEGLGIPVFLPMDADHPVDDCVGLLIGGRDRYYGEQCKIAGTFFMIPGWTVHWRRLFEQEYGGVSLEMAKRLFAHYERSLLIHTPTISPEEMRARVDDFNRMFGFRMEGTQGTLDLLLSAWQTAKNSLTGDAPDGETG